MDKILQPNFGLVFWTIVNFFILVVLLAKFAWKPIISAIDAREKKMKDDISSAQQAREEAQKIKQEMETKLEELSKQSIQKLKEAQSIAEEEKQKVLAEAKKQANVIIEQAKKEIDAQTQQAVKELKAQMADTTLLALKKFITKQTDAETSHKQVEAILKEIEVKANK